MTIFLTLHKKGGGIPQLRFNAVSAPFDVGPFHIVPIPILHGNLNILGYRINNFAFITDASFISEQSYRLLEGVSSLVLNALRYNSHGTHFSIDEACEVAKVIKAQQSYFIHFTHDISHKEASALLPESIFLAYDGLVVTL